MPFVAVVSIGTAIGLSALFNNKGHHPIFFSAMLIVLVIAYFSTSQQMYGIANGYYNPSPTGSYAFFNEFQAVMPNQNMSSFKFYQSLLSVPDAFCFVLNILPKNCNTLSSLQPNETATLCTQNKTIIVDTQPICGNATEMLPSFEKIYLYVKK